MNSKVMSDMFSFEVEVMSLRSLTPFREFSSTFVRLVSISSALAPGYDDMTITTLASNLGNLSKDMLISEKTPKIASAMNTSDVVTGLLTAFLYILIFPLLVYCNLNTILQTDHTASHDIRAVRKTFENLIFRSHATAENDLLICNGAVFI